MGENGREMGELEHFLEPAKKNWKKNVKILVWAIRHEKTPKLRIWAASYDVKWRFVGIHARKMGENGREMAKIEQFQTKKSSNNSYFIIKKK
jgi:hypothetical protein